MSAKRGSIFQQGRPEDPYNDRDGPAEVPQRATAAQLATRKIKSAKARRPAGASSTMSQNTSFSTPQPAAFSFGASAPAPTNNSASGIDFGSSNAFGGSVANSFPPAQSSAAANTFTTSSFPAFGGNTTGSGFNPQPPSGAFNFTSGGSNPFASSSSTPVNGAGSAPAFGGFGSQSQSNPFGALSQSQTNSSTTGGIFGTAATTAPATITTPATSSQPFTFGGATSFAQHSTSTPSKNGLFSGFGASAQGITSSQPQAFGGLATSSQNTPSTTDAPSSKQTLFSGFSAQNTEETTSSTPAPGSFLFNSTPAKSAAPATSTNVFGTAALGPTSATTTANAPASTPASNSFASPQKFSTTPASTPPNPFASLQKVSTTTQPAFTMPSSAQSSQDKPAVSATSNSALSSLKPAGSGSSVDAPKASLFTSSSNSATQGASQASTQPTLSMFGTTTSKDTAAGGAGLPKGSATPSAQQVSKPSLFNGFSTPQPPKLGGTEEAQGGLFNSAQPKTSSGILSQPFQSENHNSSNIFNKPQSATPSFVAQPKVSNEPSRDATVQKSTSKQTTKPISSFGSSPAPQSNTSSASNVPKNATPSSTMPTLTGTTSSLETTQEPEFPKIGTYYVPKEWAIPSVDAPDSAHSDVARYTAQLHYLNERYLQQMNSLPLFADWSKLSLWHSQRASEIKRKIDDAKKRRAAAKGITGNESILSTKRKGADENVGSQDGSPFKRARPGKASSTATPQASTPTPRLSPPATSTSNIFAKAIGSKQPSPSQPGNLFAPKPAQIPSAQPLEAAAPAIGFTPSFATSNGATTSKPATNTTGFTPNFGTTSSSTGFSPSLGGGAASDAGSFFSQFTKTAKTYEQLAAERKAKAKEEDYDSDDETEEEWSSRYDQKEAERLVEEKQQAAATPSFSVPTSGETSKATTPVPNTFSGFTKAMTSASTPGLFSPRVGSPAPSMGAQSVFDAPSAAATPTSNIFGHLSSGPSSHNQDESDGEDYDRAEDKSQDDDPIISVESTTPPKRKFGESEAESRESSEDTPRVKKQDTGSKGSLLSRMTRADDNDAESEKENNNSRSVFGQTNGTQTPTNRPFQFFDFSAAGSNTGSPKSDSFAGDQTFKPGTPIKFGDVPNTEKKNDPPRFLFQPATPSAAEFSTTPAKPPPQFSFGQSTGSSLLLAPNAGFSGPGSVASSVFSSRAGTPLSEADTSAASAAEDDDEGSKHAQVDLAKLTDEELESLDIVFHAEVALAKQAVTKGNEKAWANIAKGPLWILRDKVTTKCFVRIRIASGATPLNYQILPSFKASVTGNSMKQVAATMPKKEGGLTQVYYALKNSEIAEEFATKYNESLPSN